MLVMFRQHVRLILCGVPRSHKLGTIYNCIFRITAATIVEPAHLKAHRDIADAVDSTDAVRAAEAATSYRSSCSMVCVSYMEKDKEN
jgi:DNA-binding FadR family transcriptional regulator